MPPTNASLITFLSTSIASVPLWLYAASRGSKDVPKHRRALTVVLALHTIFILYNLFFNAPQNVFRSLNIPINAPSDRIRVRLLEASQTVDLSPRMDELISRLSSFDARALYARCAFEDFFHELTCKN